MIKEYEGNIIKIDNPSGGLLFGSSPDMSVYRFEIDGAEYSINLSAGGTIKETKKYKNK